MPPPSATPKVHSSAVAVVPPAAVWSRIQALRCLRDKSFVRWPPHINILYPFYPDGDPQLARSAPSSRSGAAHRRNGGSDAAAGAGGSGSDPDAVFLRLAIRVGRALSRVAPFRVRLERLRTFRHSARSYTLWAEPELVQPPQAPVPAGPAASSPTAAAAAGPGPLGASGLQLVHASLMSEFPDCTDLSDDPGRGITAFAPHLSLGQLRVGAA
ncbi:hypothetical protein GPECTOR_3g116 [Gonium pectorale]|uniref:Uncharacterized protein n=1 Tax=Gonium pectorale TaxID=33097 RepID=A0A150GYG4_GONPE|nr:hypothetical protein GPECTOR_3g116 [Gonium pectorale]|eukprot:KXZ54947.1 hypothetical protein GPECTOR_3g116 [Gonium pectorale]